MKKLLLSLLLALPLCGGAHVVNAQVGNVQVVNVQVVNVYTSANFAPLVIGSNSGLYPDLIAHLNRLQLHDYTFKLVYLPRKRLQLQLEEGRMDGIVIGMMPAWLDDAAERKYLWTAVFDTDRFVLVSRTLESSAPAALAGRSVGLVHGYAYPGIDDWLVRHKLVRQHAASEEANLEKLRLGRLDCVLASDSAARYFLRRHGLHGQFRLSDLPGQVVERRFVVTHDLAAVYEKLAPVIRKLRDDPAWLRIAAKYQ